MSRVTEQAHTMLREKGTTPICLTVMALLATACRAETKVQVKCTVNVTGSNCTVTYQDGADAVGVCWDIRVACANGPTAMAEGCVHVRPSLNASVVIPQSDFRPIDGQCDTPATVAIDNIRIGDTVERGPQSTSAGGADAGGGS